MTSSPQRRDVCGTTSPDPTITTTIRPRTPRTVPASSPGCGGSRSGDGTFGNHSLVVPRADGWGAQLTTFVLLSDVTEEDGPTVVVPRQVGASVPLVPDEEGEPGWRFALPHGSLAEHEVAIMAPAGSLFLYTSDVLHRGSAMTGSRRSRFALLADYQVAGPRWTGKMAWPDRALHDDWVDVIERATPAERALFGFPALGDGYWNDQTLRDVQRRYPGMDMTPYEASARR